ncbi:MAG TPA: 4'-phosphopantetheinyl transferase superfamily protein [Pseudonocardiaceae bacterium]
MIGELLPKGVVTEERRDDASEDALYPEEAAVVARAVPKRRLEFTTVRVCARAALGRLGVTPGPLLPGERGAPRWPAGVVGSMTHCAGYRAAAVARSELVRSLGIDAEPHDVLPDGVLGQVALPVEQVELGALPGGTHWDRVLFSAKESTYKAWFPLTGRWLGFEEAHVRIEPSGTFRSQLLVPGPRCDGRVLDGFDGRWRVHDGLVLTAIAVPALVPSHQLGVGG